MRIFFIILFSVSINLFCQSEIIKVQFSDSTVKEVLYEDNPQTIPRLEISINPLTYGRIRKDFIGLQMEPILRLKNGVYFSMPIMLAYKGVLDFSPLHYYNKSIREIRLIGHYPIKKIEKLKLKRTLIDYRYYHDDNMFEQIRTKFKRSSLISLYGDLGIGYSSNGFGFNLYNNTRDVRMEGAFQNVLPLYFGGSIERSTAYRITVDSITRSYFKTHRLYVNLSVNLLNSHSFIYYASSTGEQLGAETSDWAEYIPIGWRVGYDYRLGLQNSSNAMVFGVEVSQIDKLRLKSSDQIGGNIINGLDYHLRIGFSFGSKTKFSKKNSLK